MSQERQCACCWKRCRICCRVRCLYLLHWYHNFQHLPRLSVWRHLDGDLLHHSLLRPLHHLLLWLLQKGLKVGLAVYVFGHDRRGQLIWPAWQATWAAVRNAQRSPDTQLPHTWISSKPSKRDIIWNSNREALVQNAIHSHQSGKCGSRSPGAKARNHASRGDKLLNTIGQRCSGFPGPSPHRKRVCSCNLDLRFLSIPNPLQVQGEVNAWSHTGSHL